MRNSGAVIVPSFLNHRLMENCSSWCHALGVCWKWLISSCEVPSKWAHEPSTPQPLAEETWLILLIHFQLEPENPHCPTLLKSKHVTSLPGAGPTEKMTHCSPVLYSLMIFLPGITTCVATQPQEARSNSVPEAHWTSTFLPSERTHK